MHKSKRILLAPLNWGLGHAARCVPIVQCLVKNGAEVVLASDGASLGFLQQAFPDLPAHHLPGINIHYTQLPFALDMAWQAPLISRAIAKEHLSLQRLLDAESIDGIISDHRYGLWHDNIATAIICHQVRFDLPRAAIWINNLHHKMLRRFDFLWIPDFEQADGLSGALGHDHPFSKAVYLGPLSQFSGLKKGGLDKKYDLCVVISGPENGRTRFENRVLGQLKNSELKAVVAAGKPGDQSTVINDKRTYHAHLQGQELQRAIASSKVVLCRAGYSTLMDLAILGQKAIIVPTPGQREQEYLAEYHNKKGHWHAVEEQALNLVTDFKTALAFNPPVVHKSKDLLEAAVRAFLSVC